MLTKVRRTAQTVLDSNPEVLLGSPAPKYQTCPRWSADSALVRALGLSYSCAVQLLTRCVQISSSGYDINAILKWNLICVTQPWQCRKSSDAIVSEQVTNHAEPQDGCCPETLLYSMLWSLNDKIIYFSKQNKDIPLYLEKKCRVAANPALWEEIYALFFSGPMPSQGSHQGWF